jgi:hypothetical protein
VAKDSHTTIRYWVIQGVTYSVHPWSATSSSHTTFEFLRHNDLFPVGMIWEDSKSGEINSQAELTAFSRKKMGASRFAIPSGYKKTGS